MSTARIEPVAWITPNALGAIRDEPVSVAPFKPYVAHGDAAPLYTADQIREMVERVNDWYHGGTHAHVVTVDAALDALLAQLEKP